MNTTQCTGKELKTGVCQILYQYEYKLNNKNKLSLALPLLRTYQESCETYGLGLDEVKDGYLIPFLYVMDHLITPSLALLLSYYLPERLYILWSSTQLGHRPPYNFIVSFTVILWDLWDWTQLGHRWSHNTIASITLILKYLPERLWGLWVWTQLGHSWSHNTIVNRSSYTCNTIASFTVIMYLPGGLWGLWAWTQLGHRWSYNTITSFTIIMYLPGGLLGLWAWTRRGHRWSCCWSTVRAPTRCPHWGTPPVLTWGSARWTAAAASRYSSWCRTAQN